MRLLKRFGFGNGGQIQAVQKENTKLRHALAKAQLRAFHGAQNNRLVEDWLTQRASINNLLESGLLPMRQRCRDLVHRDDYAKKFRSMVVNNVVGPDGSKLELDIRDDNGKTDQKAVDIIKLAWEKWCKRKNCTVAQDMSYHELSSLLIGSAPADGGFLVRKVKGYDNPFKFALQPIDLDCLDETKNRSFDGKTSIRMGVEMDQWGRKRFYHIRTDSPYENIRATGKHRTEAIPAEEIIHAFIPLEIGQARELPWFHTVMLKLQMLNGYDEAALVAARVGAQKMGFLKKMPDAAGGYTGDGTDSDGNRIMDSAPGQIEELPAGFDFAAWDPAYPHSEHGSFNKVMLRGISSGLLCSYNSLANDLEGVNYSSIRAGLLDERDQWKTLQGWKHLSFDEIVFEDWLDMSMLTGQVKLPHYKFEKFNRPCFMGRRWAWVDPMKDIQAKILAIENGLESRTDAIAESGGSIEERFTTLENEEALAKKHKLKFSGLKGFKEEPEPAPANPQQGKQDPAE